MIIDNFNILTDFFRNNYPFNQWMIDNENPEIYLTISVIRRNKDIPNGSNLKDDELLYKTYIITSISDLEKYKEDIIMLCDGINARAYITYNAKDYSDILPAFHITIANKSKDVVKPSCIPSITDKLLRNNPITKYNGTIYYCLDIDGHDYTAADRLLIKQSIKNCGGNVILTYSTINGFHIIYASEFNSVDHKKLKSMLIDSNLLEKDQYNTISFKSAGCRALLYANINN